MTDEYGFGSVGESPHKAGELQLSGLKGILVQRMRDRRSTGGGDLPGSDAPNNPDTLAALPEPPALPSEFPVAAS